MDTLKLAIRTLLITAALATHQNAIADNSKCPFILNEIYILNWKNPRPQKIELIRNEKNQQPGKTSQASNKQISIEIEKDNDGSSYLAIKANDYQDNKMPADYDYQLIINNELEVTFHEIKTSRPNLGCQIANAKANTCEVGFGGGRLITTADCLKRTKAR